MELEDIQKVFPEATEHKISAAAQWYLNKGWSVFPVILNKAVLKTDGKIDKKPVYPIAWKIFENKFISANDPLWLKVNAIGIVTGKISKITVIDFDTKDNPEMVKLPETYTVETRRGFQLYYNFYEKVISNAGQLLAEVDFKSEGGMVFAPPSSYEMPDGSLAEYKVVKNLPLADFPVEWYEKLRAEKNISDKKVIIAEISKGVPDGNRNISAAAIVGSLLARYPENEWGTVVWDLFQAWNTQNSPPLDEIQLRKTLEAVGRKEKEKRLKNHTHIIGDATLIEEDNIISVKIPFSEGKAFFTVEDFFGQGSRFSAVFKCKVAIAEQLSNNSVIHRVEITSGSNQATLAGALDKQFNPDKAYKINWSAMVSQVCAAVTEILQKQSTEIELPEEVEDTEAEYLFAPFIEQESLGIFFGDGGSGKSYLALYLALILGCGGNFLDFNSAGGYRTWYLDYERNKKVFDKRLKRLRSPLGISHEETRKYLAYKKMANAPIHTQIKNIKETVKREGFNFLVIDSALGAAGGKPEDADNAKNLCQALKSLTIPSLLIAHINRAGDQYKPFGSGYWHNEATNTWNIQSKTEEEVGISHIGIFHRKHNTDTKMLPIGAKMEFKDGVTLITREKPVDFVDQLPVKIQILELLKNGPQTAKELHEIIGGSKDAIYQATSRLKADKKIDKLSSDKWTTI